MDDRQVRRRRGNKKPEEQTSASYYYYQRRTNRVVDGTSCSSSRHDQAPGSRKRQWLNTQTDQTFMFLIDSRKTCQVSGRGGERTRFHGMSASRGRTAWLPATSSNAGNEIKQPWALAAPLSLVLDPPSSSLASCPARDVEQAERWQLGPTLARWTSDDSAGGQVSMAQDP